jgi:hypothetical protein
MSWQLTVPSGSIRNIGHTISAKWCSNSKLSNNDKYLLRIKIRFVSPLPANYLPITKREYLDIFQQIILQGYTGWQAAASSNWRRTSFAGAPGNSMRWTATNSINFLVLIRKKEYRNRFEMFSKIIKFNLLK